MPFPLIEQMREIAIAFSQPPKQARVVTVGPGGELVGRTLRAPLNPDDTVDLLTHPRFRRIAQVRANPNMLIIWGDDPPQNAGRTIYATGVGEVLEGEAVLDWYRHRLAREGPYREMTPVDVRPYALIRFHARRFRAEYFAAEGSQLSWEEIRRGMAWTSSRS
jgi:hypothetical protein